MSAASPVVDPPVEDPPVVDPPAGGGAPISFTPEQQAHIDKLISKTVGRERTRLEGELKTLKDRGDMDEVTRLTAELADRDAAIATSAATVLATKVETRAERAALAAGVKPERLDRFMRLVDIDVDTLTADGKPDADAITALVATTLADVPEFKGAASTTGGAPTGADLTGGNGQPKTWTRAEIAALSLEDFETHEAEINAQLKAGKVK